MDTPWREVSKKAELISLPDVYLRLKSILDEPGFGMAEVAMVISRDPAVTVRLLHIVNSSLYGFTAKVETVSRAITLLGTQQVLDLVLATSVANAFKGMSSDIMDMYKFWRRSVHCAVTSRQLAALCSSCDREHLFIAGLLHDIGHLIMYQAIPNRSQQAIITAKERNLPLYEAERNIIGFDYAETGAKLMQFWSLPENLIETTMFHIEPDRAEKHPLESAIVHIAALLTKANNGEGVFNEEPMTVRPSAWAITGLSPEDCLSLHDKIEEEAREIMHLIFPLKRAD